MQRPPMIARRLTPLVIALSLAACTTQPQPCTPEWVEWKTEKVLKNFSLAHYGDVRRLRDFSQALEGDPGPLTLLKMPSMIDAFKALATEFENKAWPALEEAANQCGGAEELIPAFITYLEQEGVGEDVLEWAELLAALVTQT